MMFQQAREEVVRTCVMLADMGYLAGTGGNLALRTDNDHFLVTPSAMDYYVMQAEDVCVLRLADTSLVEGERTPSVEAGLHARVLSARPDCMASVHTHQPIAGAYTLLAMKLEVRNPQLAALLGEIVPVAAYAPSGTGWLAKRVGQGFTDFNHACLMRNHGAVCVGTDIGQAIERVVALEAACAEFFTEALNNDSKPAGASTALIKKTLASISHQHNQGLNE